MPDKRKLGILGGDLRQLAMARALSADFACAVWGIDRALDLPYGIGSGDVTVCGDWESAVRDADAVILPLPCTRDGVTLYAPLSDTAVPVLLTDIAGKMRGHGILCGGKLPSLFRRYAAEQGIVTADYFDSEELQIRNAVPTAEGAVAACMEEMPVTIAGMRCAVFGYGRVGRTLAQRLTALGGTVFAVARSTADRAWAQCDGCIAVPLADYREDPVVCGALFNTIPHRIFDAELLSKLPAETVIFELADGIDTDAAKQYGIKVIPLPSLPGKTSPVTAGEIIASAVREILNEKRNDADRTGV